MLFFRCATVPEVSMSHSQEKISARKPN